MSCENTICKFIGKVGNSYIFGYKGRKYEVHLHEASSYRKHTAVSINKRGVYVVSYCHKGTFYINGYQGEAAIFKQGELEDIQYILKKAAHYFL